MDVGVVTVGDELLTGDTVNTNAAWLCGELRKRGARARRVVVVPDEVEEIAEVVTDAAGRYDAVIVTGGLGPTHDDVTMAAIARAFERPLEENDEARRWLEEEGGYAAADLTPGTVELPAGATPLHNEVGVAPGARLADVYVLPGVPAEMRAMFGRVAGEFSGTVRHRRTVPVAEPESRLIDRLEQLRERFAVSVGSYPGDHVRVLISGADPEQVEAAAAWLRGRVELADADEESEAEG